MVMRTPQEHVETLGSSITDTLTPTDHDANAVDLKGTIDYICSQLADILGESAWETAPDEAISTLAARAKLEEKLALRELKLLTDISIASAVAATGTLTSTGQVTDGDQVTIGSTTYTYKTTLTPTAYEVLIGGTQALSMENLRRAINDDGVAGTNYASGTSAHPDVTATDTSTTVIATAIKKGTYAHTIVTTDPTDTGAVLDWSAGTLTGGAGDVKILSVASSELPSGGDNIKAVGAGTVQGLITATHTGTFGNASLDEVSGDNALNPKNLLSVVDGSTGDPIIDENEYRIWGLLQNESGATDNSAFTDTTPERAQVSFVVSNSTHDDLETIDADSIGGKSINLAFVDREDLDSWVEQDFLGRSAWVDIGAGAVTGVNLNNAIDNQGTTPATQVTDIYVRIDDDSAWNFATSNGGVNMLKVAPAAAGDEVEINVDTLDINVGAAGTVDIDNGITVDSGGTSINLGVTAGQIDSGAAALTVKSTGDTVTVDGAGVTLAANSGDLTADGDQLDADFVNDSHVIMAANDAAKKTLQLAARNSGAGDGELYLEADDDIVFETAEETTGIPLDDSTTGAISGLTGGPHASIAAAIKYAIEHGVDISTKRFVISSNFAKDANVAAATLDLTAWDIDWAGGSPDLFLFLQGRLLDGADAADQGDCYPGTTAANGDLKFSYDYGVKSGWILLSLGIGSG